MKTVTLNLTDNNYQKLNFLIADYESRRQFKFPPTSAEDMFNILIEREYWLFHQKDDAKNSLK